MPDPEDAKTAAKLSEVSSVWWQSDGCQFKQNGLTFDSEMAEKDANEIFAAYSQNGGFECQLTQWWGNMGTWGKSPISEFVYRQNHKSLSSTWCLRELAKRTSYIFRASVLFPCSTDHWDLAYVAYIYYLEYLHSHRTLDLLPGEQISHPERTRPSTSVRRDPRLYTHQVCRSTQSKSLIIIRASTAH